jgi:hypothetical protein
MIRGPCRAGRTRCASHHEAASSLRRMHLPRNKHIASSDQDFKLQAGRHRCATVEFVSFDRGSNVTIVPFLCLCEGSRLFTPHFHTSPQCYRTKVFSLSGRTYYQQYRLKLVLNITSLHPRYWPGMHEAIVFQLLILLLCSWARLVLHNALSSISLRALTVCS